MNPRRSALVVTAVAVTLLASAQADAATKHSLDGRRSKTARYNGDLLGPAIPVSGATDPTTPALDDCSDETCDIRELTLALPRQSSSGRFHATVVIDATLQASLVLYNAKGEVLQQMEGFTSPPSDTGTYVLDIHVERLSRGTYTLALVDRAGAGNFDATVAWVAHPPSRPQR